MRAIFNSFALQLQLILSLCQIIFDCSNVGLACGILWHEGGLLVKEGLQLPKSIRVDLKLIMNKGVDVKSSNNSCTFWCSWAVEIHCRPPKGRSCKGKRSRL